jgi:hypothetical protein
MKKTRMAMLLVAVSLLVCAFYSCSTDDDDEDEALSISERITRFCDDYNNSRNRIRNNFVTGNALANSDISYWNMFFGGSASNHQPITYSITTAEAISTVTITCSKYSSGHVYTFAMMQEGDNWKISGISE